MWQKFCLLERIVTEFDTITNKETIEISSATDDFKTAFWTSYVCNFKQRVSKDVNETSVVYVGMGLDFHQILYRQILRVKGRVAFRWVVLCCHQSDYLSDKKNYKTI